MEELDDYEIIELCESLNVDGLTSFIQTNKRVLRLCQEILNRKKENVLNLLKALVYLYFERNMYYVRNPDELMNGNILYEIMSVSNGIENIDYNKLNEVLDLITDIVRLDPEWGMTTYDDMIEEFLKVNKKDPEKFIEQVLNILNKYNPETKKWTINTLQYIADQGYDQAIPNIPFGADDDDPLWEEWESRYPL